MRTSLTVPIIRTVGGSAHDVAPCLSEVLSRIPMTNIFLSTRILLGAGVLALSVALAPFEALAKDKSEAPAPLSMPAGAVVAPAASASEGSETVPSDAPQAQESVSVAPAPLSATDDSHDRQIALNFSPAVAEPVIRFFTGYDRFTPSDVYAWDRFSPEATRRIYGLAAILAVLGLVFSGGVPGSPFRGMQS